MSEQPGLAPAETEPNVEFIDEEPFFKLRAAIVEQEAESGDYGEPMRFKSSVEREFQVVSASQIVEHLTRSGVTPDVQKWAVDQKIVLPSDISLMAHQSDELDEHFRLIAREQIHSLVPTTGDEEKRKQAWLAEIDDFTTEDIINFRLYTEFSTPTLKDPQPPKLADYNSLTEHAEAGKYLEFRFGKGVLQEGYYDNPGVSELRTNPYAPTETIAIEAMVMQRLADIAAEHGAVITAPGKHVNLSVYTQDETGNWSPVLGHSPERHLRTLEAVSGLSAAIESGAWITEAQARDRFTYGLGGKRTYEITGNRNAVRLQEDYIELRAPGFVDSTAQALLWSMAAISYGLEHHGQGLEGHTPAEVVQKVVVKRTENFDKSIDLQLQRALEQSKVNAQGEPAVDLNHAMNRGKKLYAAIFGDESEIEETLATVMTQLFVSALKTGTDGRVRFNKQKMIANRQALPELYDDTLGKPMLDLFVTDSALALMDLFVRRDAVRVEVQNVIQASPMTLGLEPGGVEAQWIDSPIINRMYGQQTAAYAHQIFKIGEQHYEPIDISDSASFNKAMLELLARFKT